MRIEEAAAHNAPKAGSRNERVRVAERVPSDVLLLAGPFAAGAAKLPVESIECFALWCEFVLVPFHQLCSYFRVERLEVHGAERRRQRCLAQ